MQARQNNHPRKKPQSVSAPKSELRAMIAKVRAQARRAEMTPSAVAETLREILEEIREGATRIGEKFPDVELRPVLDRVGSSALLFTGNCP